MSVRVAELLMAVVLALLSVYLMLKSAELPIGWIPREGPGGGAFPFWLAAIMLASCVWTMVRWFMRVTPQSVSREPFIEREALVVVLPAILSLVVMVAGIRWIGVYGVMPLFFIFYMRFLGHHSWLKTLCIGLLAPVVTFFFFEVLLHITLPKGLTEELFYPLYDIFM